MADQVTTTVTETPATPAEAQTTEIVTTPEHMIPKTRFDEISKRARDAEKQLADLQRSKEDADKAKLTEQQEFEKLYQTEQKKAGVLEKRLEELQATVRREKILRAVEAEARKAQFAEPADAFAFVNLDDIEVDDSGAVKGVEAMVKKLATSKPYLLSQNTPAPGNSQSPRPAGAAGDAAKTEAARQTARNFYQNKF